MAPFQQPGEKTSAYSLRKKEAEAEQTAIKEHTQSEFEKGHLTVVVASEAFGMGINHPRVRRLLDLGPPKLIEQLLNHIGRAGRDGLEATCTLMCKPSDFNEHEAFLKAPEERCSDESKARQLASINAQRAYVDNVAVCRWVQLMHHWGEAELPDQSKLHDPSWRCGTCDNCLCLAKDGVRHHDFGDVVTWLLTVLKHAQVCDCIV